MRKIAALIVLPLAVAACGTAKPQSPQAKQAEMRVEKQIDACLPQKDGAPDPLLLKSKAARSQFTHCVVPASREASLNRCLVTGLPTKAHAIDCVEKNS